MSSAEHDFRRVSFTSPQTVDRRWIEWFCDEYSRRVYQSNVEIEADTPFRMETSVRLLPDLAIHIGDTAPMRWERNGHEESFGMGIPLAGQLVYKVDGADVVIEPGAAIISRLPDRLDTHADTRFLSVRLSPRLLAALVPDFADMSFLALPANTQALRLLTSYLKALDAEDRIETPEARHLVALHVHDLAALALGASRDATVVAQERGGRAARLAAVKQDILAHLDDPALSVARVAARQGVSPRYIHLLFEREGMTYSEFIVAKRLARAYRMLIDPGTTTSSIGEIALKVGFGDLSYFNRTFRRRFGMTPTDVRAMARGR